VAEPVEIGDSAAFDALVRDAPQAIVVDFWAPWCGPCRMVAPEIARVASAHAGEYIIVKVNTDEVVDLADRFRIQSIPTMMVFKDGREAGRTAGAMPAPRIEEFIRQSLRQ
jgi:thioredoxin